MEGLFRADTLNRRSAAVGSRGGECGSGSGSGVRSVRLSGAGQVEKRKQHSAPHAAARAFQESRPGGDSRRGQSPSVFQEAEEGAMSSKRFSFIVFFFLFFCFLC
jgi:hypothetical protein